MSAGTLPRPGKVVGGCEVGPCLDTNCGHGDCVLTRRQAARLCVYSNRPIGYDTDFYRVGVNKMAHAVCHTDAIEKSGPASGR